MNNIFKEIIKKDKHKCQAYGCSSRNIEIHHIIPRSQGGPDEDWNLICLCPLHHRLVTDGILSNIELLEKIKKRTNFRWKKALEWHKKRRGNI